LLLGPTVPLISWFEARDAARDLNKCCGKAAHLVSITSSQEALFLRSLSNDGWIGLNNLNQTSASKFVWDGTSEAVSYTFWCGTPQDQGGCSVQYPIGGANRCTYSYGTASANGRWLDADCSERAARSFFIEYDCD
jgi:hypothetical protein